MDESRTLVRPNFKLSRTTIILRDLTGVNEEEGECVDDVFGKILVLISNRSVRKFFVSDVAQFSPTAVVKEVVSLTFSKSTRLLIFFFRLETIGLSPFPPNLKHMKHWDLLENKRLYFRLPLILRLRFYSIA